MRSIKVRLLAYIGLASLVFCLLIGVLLIHLQSKNDVSVLHSKAHIAMNSYRARFVSLQTLKAQNPSPDETRKLLSGDLFASVAIWDSQQPERPVQQLDYSSPYVFNLDAMRAKQAAEELDAEYIYYPITLNGIELGFITARLQMDELHEKQRTYWTLLSVCTLFALLLSIVLAQRLHLMIMHPIKRLSKVAGKISANKDYTLRMETRGVASEMAGLYQQFNGMLDETHNQQQAFKELNQNLEQRIEARIRDLKLAKDSSEQMLNEMTEARNRAEALAVALETKQAFEHKISEFTETLQSKGTSNIENWGEFVLQTLVNALNAVQGALYSATRIEGDVKLRLLSTYGLDKKSILKKTVKAGDGMAGQVVKNKELMLLHPVPSEFLKVESTLGEAPTASALVIPLIAEEQVQGLIEIGSLQQMGATETQFVEHVSRSIAYTLLIIKNRDDIADLLAGAQTKNEQLQSSEDALKKREEELRHINENLEQLVAKRTEALASTLEDLQTTQSQLVQNEKMASLGQLISGIAHEINTPIGAIKASAGNLKDSIPQIVQNLSKLSRELAEKEYTMFVQMMEHLLHLDPNNLSSREQRKKRKEVSQQLAEWGIAAHDEYARAFVGMGLNANLETYKPLLAAPQSDAIVDTLYHISQLNLNADNIDIASERTKKIIVALKTYSYKQKEDEMVAMDVCESLNVILTLYHGQLRQGVTVETDYPKNLPRVMAFPDEIGQVWTNIITNAIHAMDYSGTLGIRVWEEEERVHIAITDDGPGIPPELQEKIFSPFFTTKRQGEGTGLGLDISRKIIDKHNGVIRLASEPGNTVFRIVLPKAPDDIN